MEAPLSRRYPWDRVQHPQRQRPRARSGCCASRRGTRRARCRGGLSRVRAHAHRQPTARGDRPRHPAVLPPCRHPRAPPRRLPTGGERGYRPVRAKCRPQLQSRGLRPEGQLPGRGQRWFGSHFRHGHGDLWGAHSSRPLPVRLEWAIPRSARRASPGRGQRRSPPRLRRRRGDGHRGEHLRPRRRRRRSGYPLARVRGRARAPGPSLGHLPHGLHPAVRVLGDERGPWPVRHPLIGCDVGARPRRGGEP
mmetsp:Transcript_31633/g.100874  ORF Transcript_31633/g.100874 Transcript_31633/m.100874 type:complete len:250 (-) Transcript_31633:244-993(-)